MVEQQPGPEPSDEAKAALAAAKDHRATSEAALPAALNMRDRLRELLAANHFTDLMTDTLRAAAPRR